MESHLIQGSEAWLKWRNNHIGSSNAMVCMGDYRYQTPYELYLEKKGMGKPWEGNVATAHGNALEEEARQAFERRLDVSVFPVVRKHSKYDFMAASMDGLDMDGKIAVEIKCPYAPKNHEIALSGNVPEHNIPQLQHQMEVLNLDSIYFFSYTTSSQALIIVKRDEKYIKELVEKENEFWDRVTNSKPPELTDKDYVNLESNEWKELTDEYKKLEEIANRKEEIRKRLIEIANNKNVKGSGVTLTKVIRKGTIRYAEIPSIRSLDLESYRSPPSESWRITLN